MRHYKYRWLIALALSGIVVALGFIYDIQPRLNRLAELRVLEQRLIKQLAEMKALTDVSKEAATLPRTQSDHVATIARFANEQRLFIQSIDYVAPRQSSASEAELIVLVFKAVCLR